jgi:hypothetical protein
MISLRSKPARAGIASALTLLTLCAAMLVLPASGMAAPAEGEGSPPEAPASPQLSFQPGSYDFGLRQVNNGGEATLQLRNDGEVAAQVLSLEITGPGAGVFWINGGATNCYGRNLQPAESCSVQVVFNPYDAASFSAQLRANSEGGTVFTADLSGEGGRAAIGPASDPTSFGAAAVGSPGVTRTIDITNRGNYPGGAFIAVIAGGAIGSFHLLDENCTGIPLSPGASCTLLVSFQPLSTGVKTARLGLFGDSDGGSQITLTGVGTEPESPAASESPSTSGAVGGTRDKRRAKHRRNRGGHLRPAVSARWASR